MNRLLILLILYIWVIYCYDSRYEADFNTPDNEFELRWRNDFTREDIEIEVCKVNEENEFKWMGIGFSDHGEMENADLFAVNLMKLKAEDMHTNDRGILWKDSETNYDILEMSVTSDKSCFKFVREWNTCDKNDYVIDRGTTNILLFSLTNGWSFLEGIHLKDLNPSLQLLQLIRSMIPINEVRLDTPYFDVVVGKNEILNVSTTYWCKVIKLPVFPTKNHIIKYEGLISKGSVGIVHHMELFHCSDTPSSKLLDYNAPCNSETKPMGLTMCRRVIAAWAMGAGPFTYPADVGNPIGGSDFISYAILEVHYNNPQQLSGIIDNSGLRLYYTPDIRKYDAGIIELGLEYVDKNSIPPGLDHFTLSGFCVPECLEQALPRDGIFVFGSQLHTHLTGIKVETLHFRENKELRPLNRDIHYQPHYQEIRLLSEIVNVLPGDSLVTSCTYNTKNKTEMTLGGIAITDEMCLNYIFYYPRIEFELCKSSVSDVALRSFLGSSVENLRMKFNEVRWTNGNVHLLSDLYHKAPIHQSCNKSDSQSYPGNWDFINPVEMKSTKEEGENDECIGSMTIDV